MSTHKPQQPSVDPAPPGEIQVHDTRNELMSRTEFLLTIKIAYFAILRDQTGLSNEVVRTKANTAQALFDELNERYHFSLDSKAMRVAINNSFVDWQTVIQNNDEVVFIPPVAGG